MTATSEVELERTLKKKSFDNLGWIERPNTKQVFGPPVYDERPNSHRWRYFKRGFVWGSSVAFILGAQFSGLQHYLHPGKNPFSYLALLPFGYAVGLGCFFGYYEIMTNPMIDQKAR